MNISAPTPTRLQHILNIYLQVFDSSDIPQAAFDAISAYASMVNTPSLMDLIELNNVLNQQTSLLLETDTPTQINLSMFQNVILSELNRITIGTPTDNLILTNQQYPMDDLGVTYTTMTNLLKAVLSSEANKDTVANFAAAIFYSINALNPTLTLEQLTADLQATVDSVIDLPSLATNIVESLDALTSPDAASISAAIYSHMFPAEQAALYSDILHKHQLTNLLQVKENLTNACTDNDIDTIDEFAQAIFNSMLSLTSPKLTLDRIKEDVEAGIANENVGSLATLKTNILTKLAAIEDFNTSADLLRDAVFFEDGLIPSSPHDLSVDLPPANKLIGLQQLKTALMQATDNFAGLGADLASAIKTAVTDNGGGDVLPLVELANDIAASGDAAELATRIYNSLDALDSNALTAANLAQALYAPELIIVGHKKNLVDDLEASQTRDNYKDTVVDMFNDFETYSNNPNITAENIADVIINNLSGSTHTLTREKLIRDISASLENRNLGDLRVALQAALYPVQLQATITADDIMAAIYAPGSLISSDVADMTADINAAETALDYRSLILQLQDVCLRTQGANPSITNTAQFSAALVNEVQNFPSSAISVTSEASDIEAAMDTVIANQFYDIDDIKELGSRISDALQNLLNNQLYSAAAIEGAIFNIVSASSDLRLSSDAMRTENLISLYTIKNALATSLCSTSLTSLECANEIITKVKNGVDFTPDIVAESLAADITASAAQTQEIGMLTKFQSLMQNIETNLQALQTNALTAEDIKNALYASNALVSSVPYFLTQDLANANSLKNIQRIKASLLDYLETINTPQTDVTSIAMARGMLAAINISGGEVANSLTDVQLAGDISYTISQDETNFGTGNYNLANALILALQSSGDTSLAVTQAVFSAGTILRVSETCEVSPYNEDDNTDFLNYVDAVNAATKSYNLIITGIVNNLTGLTGGYNALDVAEAITNAIIVSGERMLTASSLKESLDATSGNLSDKVTALIDGLSTLSSNSATDLDQVMDKIFASESQEGVLADPVNNPTNLLNDINTAVGLTDNYPAIKQKIYDNLNGVSSDINVENYATAIANAIVSAVHFIAEGSNGSLNRPYLGVEDIKTDILFTASSAENLYILQANLLTALNNLSGGDISAVGIREAIYGDNTIQLNSPNGLSDLYEADLEASADAHSSFSEILAKFANNLNKYTNNGMPSAIASELATDIKDSVVGISAITPITTQTQLTGNIGVTVNDVLTVGTLGSNILTSVNQADIDDVDTAAANLANAVYGSNILANYDAKLIGDDIVANKLSRESEFYQAIKVRLSSMYGGEFAGLAQWFINTVDAPAPINWNLSRVQQDVLASTDQSSYNDFRLELFNKMFTLNVFTKDSIANVIYSAGLLVLSPQDKTDMQTDLDADISSYGGTVSIAANILAELQNLPTDYVVSDVANAIVYSITPLAVNPNSALSASYVAYDIDFTIEHREVTLTDLVAELISNLEGLVTNESATIDDLNDAIYDLNGGIVATDRDEVNFGLDVETSRDEHNNYSTIRSLLASMDNTAVYDAVSSILSSLELSSNSLTESALTATFNANLGSTTIETLVNQLTTNITNADVSDVTTAPYNLAWAFYPPFKAVSQFNLATDVTSADEIDNAVTIVSALGGEGVCSNGASHIVYSCTKSNGVAQVAEIIAVNNCSVASAINAARDCDTWASLRGVDHYLSSNGVDCTGYLQPQDAASLCKAMLYQ